MAQKDRKRKEREDEGALTIRTPRPPLHSRLAPILRRESDSMWSYKLPSILICLKRHYSACYANGFRPVHHVVSLLKKKSREEEEEEEEEASNC